MATPHGTCRFLTRYIQSGKLNPANVRQLGRTGLKCSAVGFGAYRIGGGDKEGVHRVALTAAVRDAGINLLDTSSHYSAPREGENSVHGASEQLIGRTLQNLISDGIAERDELIVCTKVGHVCPGATPPPDSVRLSPASEIYHSLDPTFIEAEVVASKERLGTAADFVLLHNPEYFLTNAMADRVAIADAWDAMYGRLYKAFVVLERLVADGVIGNGYGVSSNFLSCMFSASGRSNVYEALQLERVLDAAAAAAGSPSHHMRIVQMPLNSIESGAVLGRGNVLPEAAEGDCIAAANSNIAVMVNRPLNAIPVPGVSAGDWGRADQHIRLKDKKPMGVVEAMLKRTILDAISNGGIDEPSQLASLQQLCLQLAASPTSVSVCLNGMISEQYVADASAVLGAAPLPNEVAERALSAVRQALVEMGGQHRGLW